MASLFDNPDEESSFVAELQKRQARAGASPTKQTGKGGLLTSLISEGGALGGGAAGAAIGSVVPVVGTAIGGIIGAGLGAFGGRLAENKVRDNRYGVGDAAKEGLLSGALSAVAPLAKAGKGAIVASKAAKGATLADDAVKLATKAPTRNAVTRASQASLGNAWGVRSGVKLNGQVVTPQRVGKLQSFVVDELKVPKSANADQVLEYASSHKTAVGDAISSVISANKSTIDTPALAKRLTSKFNTVIGSGGVGKNAVADDILRQVNEAKTPADLWKVQQSVDDLINFGANEASATPGTQQIATAARKEINALLKQVSPEYKKLAPSYSSARDVIELSGQAARTPKGAKIPGMNATVAGPQVQSVRALAGNAGRAVGGAQQNLATALATPVATGAKRALTGEALSKLFTAPDQGNSIDMTTQATMNQNNNSIMPELSAPQPEMSTEQSPYTRENLMMDIQRDPKNADQYVEYYQMLESIYNPEPVAPPKTSATERQRSTTAQSGLRSLGTLEEALVSDPGAFQRQALPNPLGITARLTGTSEIRSSTDNIIDVIARLRSGAAITDSEAARFARLLPQAGDNQQAAQFKLEMVRAELENIINGSGGSTTLEDALLR